MYKGQQALKHENEDTVECCRKHEQGLAMKTTCLKITEQIDCW